MGLETPGVDHQALCGTVVFDKLRKIPLPPNDAIG
jgi:hypothetical protein